ncbi:hypothetical protein ACJX0J_019157, partial [Zea mays]
MFVLLNTHILLTMCHFYDIIYKNLYDIIYILSNIHNILLATPFIYSLHMNIPYQFVMYGYRIAIFFCHGVRVVSSTELPVPKENEWQHPQVHEIGTLKL